MQEVLYCVNAYNQPTGATIGQIQNVTQLQQNTNCIIIILKTIQNFMQQDIFGVYTLQIITVCTINGKSIALI